LRNSWCCCVISIPSHSLELDILRNVEHLSDAVVELQSYSGLGIEPHEAFAEFSGTFKVKKLPSLNSLIIPLPETLNLVYKLKRRKLQIEIPHLGPQETRTGGTDTGNGNGKKSTSTSSSKKSSTSTSSSSSSSSSSLLCQPGPPSKASPLDF